jgi:hypothetical protein
MHQEAPVKTITLRGIDQELETALQAKSKEFSTNSLNSTILRVLNESLGLSKRRYGKVHHDLDHLAGTWTDADLEEFEEATAVFEQIDAELWQ